MQLDGRSGLIPTGGGIYARQATSFGTPLADHSPRKRVLSLVFVFTLLLFVTWSIIGLFYEHKIFVWLIVLTGWFLSLAIHEWSHAATAYMGGDHSVMEKGYLSLNFLKYMDPIMSLIVPMALLILGGIPLPGGSVLIQESQLQSKLWSSLTSLAGPAGNLVCGIILRLILLVSGLLVTALGPYAGNMRHYRHISMGATPRAWSVLIYLQVLAAVLNLVPLPPLDGWGAVSPFLPDSFFLKKWLRESVWNGRTMALITFTLLFVVITQTRLLNMLTQPVMHVFFLDRNQLASGLAAFFF